MKYLDENPEKRIALIKNLQIKLLSGVRKGEFIINMINEHNKKNGIDVEIPFDFSEEVHRNVKKITTLF